MKRKNGVDRDAEPIRLRLAFARRSRHTRAVHRCLALGLALCLSFLGGGCRTSRPSHKLTWRTLSRGLTSGLTEPRRLVVRDEATYLALWAEHAAEVNRVAMPPSVNFEREMVVLVAMGERPTGGYLLEVVDVELEKRTLRVLLSERAPIPGTLQMQIATQPYQFIALPMVDAHVHFRVATEAGRPGGERRARPGEEGPKVRSKTKSAPPKPVLSPREAATQSGS